MTAPRMDASQRMAARVAGWSYLVTFALVVFAQFGIHGRLIVGGDAAQTARNILAHERLFRVGTLCDLLYCVGFIGLIAALYVILKPVSPGLAFVSSLWKVVYVVVWCMATIDLFDALRLLHNVSYMQTFQTGQMQSLARFTLGRAFDLYYVALLFSALGSTVAGYLWFKSRYIPRVLGALGVITSAFCVLCTVAFILFPNFDSIVSLSVFDTPMGIVDIVTSFWLIFKGLRLPPDATAV